MVTQSDSVFMNRWYTENLMVKMNYDKLSEYRWEIIQQTRRIFYRCARYNDVTKGRGLQKLKFKNMCTQKLSFVYIHSNHHDNTNGKNLIDDRIAEIYSCISFSHIAKEFYPEVECTHIHNTHTQTPYMSCIVKN